MLSIVVGIIAIWHMQLKNLNITPELKENHILITSGIYSYIRHPMHSSILLFAISALITRYNYLTIGIFIILIIDLYLKSQKEEKYLLREFIRYKKYMQTTGRFLPKVIL